MFTKLAVTVALLITLLSSFSGVIKQKMADVSTNSAKQHAAYNIK